CARHSLGAIGDYGSIDYW
nr:immunoglobulin heavy chain junction region [Macaca mulatta]MOV43815.1 immunoglobulin heavy chain junction region [Macaca mulatta]